LLRIGRLRVLCHGAGLNRVVVQDQAVRLYPVVIDKSGEHRMETAIASSAYDRESQTLRLDVPRGEGAVEFLIRVLPEIL